MKINVNQILTEGSHLEEDIVASTLDLETEVIRFRGPLKISADITKITNAVNVDVFLKYSIYINCVRCLTEFESDLKKNFRLNYVMNKSKLLIDLDPDIKEEIILDYPLKPLCILNCKGLCPKCGRNLNEGNCSCK